MGSSRPSLQARSAPTVQTPTQIEYDASMLACPTPAVEALESDASAGSADMLGSMLGSAEDASMPSWAAGGRSR